jgi:hypothetical protein
MDVKLENRRGFTLGRNSKLGWENYPAEGPNEFYVICWAKQRLYYRGSEQRRGRLACARLSEHRNLLSFGLFLRRKGPRRLRRHQNILKIYKTVPEKCREYSLS